MIDRPEQGLFSKWCPSPVKRRRPGAWVFDPLSEQEEWEDYYEQLDDDLVEYEIKQLLGERRQRRKAGYYHPHYDSQPCTKLCVETEEVKRRMFLEGEWEIKKFLRGFQAGSSLGDGNWQR